MAIASGRTLSILLIEDNPGDAKLVQEALKDGHQRHQLHVVEDGEAALRFLHHQGKYGDAPRPDLILLDLNLPRKDGREVLAEIKSDENLHCIPVVVLSTSGAEEDIRSSYQMHANCYVTKPLGLEEFMRVVRNLETFWLSTVQLPPSGKDGL